MNTGTFKNLVAPLLEKRNLITIILIALFFGIFRLSGGGIKTTSDPKASLAPAAKNSAAVENGAEVPSELRLDDFDGFSPGSPTDKIRNLRDRGKASQGNSDSAAASKERELFNKMLAESKPKAPKKDNKKSQLDDIEKALGLR